MSARHGKPEEKTASLRRYGALNPHPEKVADEEFLANDFFDAHDLVQVKYEMVRRVQQQGQSVTRVAAAFGLSRTSYYEAQAAFEDGGLPGLIPQRPGPRRAHKLSDEVLQFIEDALATDGETRAKELSHLVQERFGLSVHPRSIERALDRRKKKPRQYREKGA